jgi:hypothetical protein
MSPDEKIYCRYFTISYISAVNKGGDGKPLSASLSSTAPGLKIIAVKIEVDHQDAKDIINDLHVNC